MAGFALTFRIAEMTQTMRRVVGSQSQRFPFRLLAPGVPVLLCGRSAHLRGAGETKKDSQGWGPSVCFDGLPMVLLSITRPHVRKIPLPLLSATGADRAFKLTDLWGTLQNV